MGIARLSHARGPIGSRVGETIRTLDRAFTTRRGRVLEGQNVSIAGDGAWCIVVLK